MSMVIDAMEAGMMPDYMSGVGYALAFDQWGNPLSVVISVLAVLISASCMYRLGSWILSRSEFSPRQARKSALWLSVATAPCMFLLPPNLLYGTGI